jgi:aminoglycoside phosphotransferase (APT) family kinase protein
MKMPEQPTFPPEVQAVLGEIYHITSPKQGATSQVWMVECAAGRRVVKHAPRLPFRDWLFREALVLEGLKDSGLPIPIRYLDGSQLSEPLPYLVMSLLVGEPLSSVIEESSDTTRRLNLISAFGVMLRKIHDTPAPQALHHEIPWLDERLNTAAAYIKNGFEPDAEDPPRLLEQMRASHPEPVPQTLIHGDFMWDNVLVQDDHISGIVDWGGGAYGDPRYDLALAILPHEDGEISDAEVSAFYEGYGCEPLTESEYRYFTNLYEFF